MSTSSTQTFAGFTNNEPSLSSSGGGGFQFTSLHPSSSSGQPLFRSGPHTQPRRSTARSHSSTSETAITSWIIDNAAAPLTDFKPVCHDILTTMMSYAPFQQLCDHSDSVRLGFNKLRVSLSSSLPLENTYADIAVAFRHLCEPPPDCDSSTREWVISSTNKFNVLWNEKISPFAAQLHVSFTPHHLFKVGDQINCLDTYVIHEHFMCMTDALRMATCQ
jgi:hypothetical protein